MVCLKQIGAALALAASNAVTVSALPSGQALARAEATQPLAGLQARQDDKVALRILPLGASIMSGQGSPEHSGLRKWLRMQLRFDGWDVNMVGGLDDGTDMADNDHEATPGLKVNEIREHLGNSLPYKPNVVIINGGTNNANQNDGVNEAYDQMNAILDDVWNNDGSGDACIILSTLLVTGHEEGAKNRGTINEQYRNLVRDRKDDKCIFLADMEPEGEGKDFISLDDDIWDPADGASKIHPNNEGHKRMAYVFYAALRRALDGGRVPEAAEMDGSLKDNSGDDNDEVVNPELPEQPGNPIGGPGPGDL